MVTVNILRKIGSTEFNVQIAAKSIFEAKQIADQAVRDGAIRAWVVKGGEASKLAFGKPDIAARQEDRACI